jgi:hypothetical protein
MFEASPFAYALTFFLGIVLYTPILLFSSGKYKSGLKCAAAICLWLLMMTATTSLMSYINPDLLSSLMSTPGKSMQNPKSAPEQDGPSQPILPEHKRSSRKKIKSSRSRGPRQILIIVDRTVIR